MSGGGGVGGCGGGVSVCCAEEMEDFMSRRRLSAGTDPTEPQCHCGAMPICMAYLISATLSTGPYHTGAQSVPDAALLHPRTNYHLGSSRLHK